MRGIKDIVECENANSGLSFRDRVYDESELGAMAQDILGLANANVTGPRFLCIGVRDIVGGERSFTGIRKQDLVSLKDRLRVLLSGFVEPSISASLSGLEIGGAAVGIVCLMDCDDPPYLLKEPLGEELPAGIGFVRRGTRLLPLLRPDLRRMFESRAHAPSPEITLRVGFPGAELSDQITLPVLDLPKLPSEVAAERLRALLDMKQGSREMFGRTETGLSRLMYTKLFGPDAPFEAFSDDSLRMRIDRSVDDFRDADEHYRYEVRAHKINLGISNDGATDVRGVALRMTVQRIDGVGIAERVYREDGDSTLEDGYPLVSLGASTITLQGDVGIIPPGCTVKAFRESPRLWLRKPASGKSIVVDYALSARELAEPIRDTLLIHVERSAS